MECQINCINLVDGQICPAYKNENYMLSFKKHQTSRLVSLVDITLYKEIQSIKIPLKIISNGVEYILNEINEPDNIKHQKINKLILDFNNFGWGANLIKTNREIDVIVLNNFDHNTVSCILPLNCVRVKYFYSTKDNILIKNDCNCFRICGN